MIPLTLVNENETATIKRLSGKPEVKKHLENLGFVPGSTVTVINEINGNMIVVIKEARVAISKEMAQRIMV